MVVDTEVVAMVDMEGAVVDMEEVVVVGAEDTVEAAIGETGEVTGDHLEDMTITELLINFVVVYTTSNYCGLHTTLLPCTKLILLLLSTHTYMYTYCATLGYFH